MAQLTRVRYVAPAKINLYLGVHTARDSRGYHLVDSCMAAVGLFDQITVERADRLSVCFESPAAFGAAPANALAHTPAADFIASHANVAAPECPEDKNTCYKAATLMGEAYGFTPNVRIRIAKRIPAQAGLGGSSADAVATIRALCQLFDLTPPTAELASLAARVGADVPFFLTGAPAYFGGAGDVLMPLPSAQHPAPAEKNLVLSTLPLVLVRPQGPGVSTPAAYQEFDREPVPAAPLEPMLQALANADPDAVVGAMANNLQPVAERLHPPCAQALAWLKRQPNVLAAQVSGSGSCSFAICTSQAAATRIALEAQTQLDQTGEPWWACATHIISHGPVLLGRS